MSLNRNKHGERPGNTARNSIREVKLLDCVPSKSSDSKKVTQSNDTTPTNPTNKSLSKLVMPKKSSNSSSPAPNQQNSQRQVIGQSSQSSIVSTSSTSGRTSNGLTLTETNSPAPDNLVNLLRQASDEPSHMKIIQTGAGGGGGGGGSGGPGPSSGSGGPNSQQSQQQQQIAATQAATTLTYMNNPHTQIYTPTIVQKTPLAGMRPQIVQIADPNNEMEGSPITLMTPSGQHIQSMNQFSTPSAGQLVMTPQGLMMQQPAQQPKLMFIKTDEGENQLVQVVQEPQLIPVQTIKQPQHQTVMMVPANQAGGGVRHQSPQFIHQIQGQSEAHTTHILQPALQPQQQQQQQQKPPGLQLPSGPQGGSGGQGSSAGSSQTGSSKQLGYKRRLNMPNKKSGGADSRLGALAEVAGRELNKKPKIMLGDNKAGLEFRERERQKAVKKSSFNQFGPTAGSPSAQQLAAVQQVITDRNMTERHMSGDSLPIMDSSNSLIKHIPGTKSTAEKNRDKRERNKLAARRCRQRKMDKIKTLEDTVTRMNDVLSQLRHTLQNVKRFANDNKLSELQNIVGAIDLDNKLMQPFDLRKLDEELMTDEKYQDRDFLESASGSLAPQSLVEQAQAREPGLLTFANADGTHQQLLVQDNGNGAPTLAVELQQQVTLDALTAAHHHHTLGGIVANIQSPRERELSTEIKCESSEAKKADDSMIVARASAGSPELKIQTEAPHDVLPQSPSPAAGSAANVTAAPPTATITTKSTKEIEETEKDKNESVITK